MPAGSFRRAVLWGVVTLPKSRLREPHRSPFCQQSREGFDRDQKIASDVNFRKSDSLVVDVIWLTERNAIS
jgi:hypothetical protein